MSYPRPSPPHPSRSGHHHVLWCLFLLYISQLVLLFFSLLYVGLLYLVSSIYVCFSSTEIVRIFLFSLFFLLLLEHNSDSSARSPNSSSIFPSLLAPKIKIPQLCQTINIYVLLLVPFEGKNYRWNANCRVSLHISKLEESRGFLRISLYWGIKERGALTLAVNY